MRPANHRPKEGCESIEPFNHSAMEQFKTRVRRIVLKLGTGILTSGVGQLDTAKIMALGREVAALRKAGLQVMIVSSGAVGLGMGRLGLAKRPAKLTSVQKCAAVGQSILIDTWQRAFNPFGLTVAQLLYTRDNLGPRGRATSRSRNCSRKSSPTASSPSSTKTTPSASRN